MKRREKLLRGLKLKEKKRRPQASRPADQGNTVLERAASVGKLREKEKKDGTADPSKFTKGSVEYWNALRQQLGMKSLDR